jgi:hypothetical protein
MKKIAIGLSLGALALAGTAYAQHHMGHAGDDGAAMTRAQAQTKSTEMFAHMDVNKDGKLDTADRDARMGEKFDTMDADKNGQLSRAEFMAAHQDRMGDGNATSGHGGRHGMHHGHGGMMKMMAMKADSNNDGAVSQAEFAAAAMQRFERADTNKDGQVTREERRTAHAGMRGRWHGAPTCSASGAASGTPSAN